MVKCSHCQDGHCPACDTDYTQRIAELEEDLQVARDGFEAVQHALAEYHRAYDDKAKRAADIILQRTPLDRGETRKEWQD
jgi:capsule polysaccharide modification protein KpsS